MFRLLSITSLISLVSAVAPVFAQAPAAPTAPATAAAPTTARPPRPAPPTRDPNTPGYVKAKELEDGAVPSPKEDGNFIIGPTHNPAPEMTVKVTCHRERFTTSRWNPPTASFIPALRAKQEPSPGPIQLTPLNSLSPATPLLTRASLQFMFPSNMSQER